MVHIGDIARRAGVSRSTVSYVLSGKRSISATTQERVQAVIDELGYQPSATARALRAGRTGTLALLVPRPRRRLKPSQLPFVAAVVDIAQQRDLDVLLSTAAPTPGGLDHVSRLVNERRVDGVLVMETTISDPTVDVLVELGATFATIGRPGGHHRHDWVDLDHEEAVGSCVRHLYSLGHRRIALITGNHTLSDGGYGPTVYSRAGFEDAVLKAGMTGSVHACGDSIDEGYALGTQLLHLPDRPTALLSINDGALLGLAGALQAAGLAIPDDISLAVTVVKDALPAGLPLPALTGVELPVEEMARVAVKAVWDRLADAESPAVQSLLSSPLVVRASTAAAKT